MSKKQTISKPKQLTMSKIKNEARQISKMEEYIINNNNEAIKFYPIFPVGRIDKMLAELREDLLYAEEKGINLYSTDEFLLEYIYFLCIKYFTSLEKGFSKKLEDKILQLEYMKDTGYYDQIVKEVFLPTELNKVTDKLAEIFAMNQLLTDLEKKTQDYLGRLQFRNQELLESLNEQLEQAEKTELKQ